MNAIATNKLFYITMFALAVLVTLWPELALAEIKKPDFVKEVNPENLNQAGSEINKWIFIGMAVIIGLFSIRPGYLLITGKPDEALEKSKEIIFGAIAAVVFGGIVFAVVGQLS